MYFYRFKGLFSGPFFFFHGFAVVFPAVVEGFQLIGGDHSLLLMALYLRNDGRFLVVDGFDPVTDIGENIVEHGVSDEDPPYAEDEEDNGCGVEYGEDGSLSINLTSSLISNFAAPFTLFTWQWGG